DLLAASLFYKRFEHPIEQIVYSSGDLSYANAAQASAYGAELEARTSLSRFHRAFRDLRAWANLSLIRSEVELSAAQMSAQTHAAGPVALRDQPRRRLRARRERYRRQPAL